jgi:4'-phosphopantetheinyl transferase
MDSNALIARSADIWPVSCGQPPALIPIQIHSFHEAFGLWKKHDILILLADIRSIHCNYAENLDCQENLQKNRYITQYARRRYSVSRTLAKLLLASILEIESPGDITLEKEPAGGIRVAGDDSVFLCISYAQNLLALAISRSRVGIDIEHIRPVAVHHIPMIADTICGGVPEEGDDGVGFLRHWTAMEACAKYSDTPLWKMLQNPGAGKEGHTRSCVVSGSLIMSLVTEAPCQPERMPCVVTIKNREENQV